MKARVLKLHHNTIKQLVKLQKAAERTGEHRVAKRIHTQYLEKYHEVKNRINGVAVYI